MNPSLDDVYKSVELSTDEAFFLGYLIGVEKKEFFFFAMVFPSQDRIFFFLECFQVTG